MVQALQGLRCYQQVEHGEAAPVSANTPLQPSVGHLQLLVRQLEEHMCEADKDRACAHDEQVQTQLHNGDSVNKLARYIKKLLEN